MVDDIIIEKAARLLGIPTNNVKSIFDGKTSETAIEILDGIESLSMEKISQRLNLSEIYQSLTNESQMEVMSNIYMTLDQITSNEELVVEIGNQISKKLRKKFIEWIRGYNHYIKIKYSGKNITSSCSKLPHVPHYDKKKKSFCCGINGNIELINHTIQITTIIDKLNGNRSRQSAVIGGYRIQIIDR